MKVAVLLSTYNGEKYLREQLDSIFFQKGNFQIDLWVRDDGSTDATQEILKEYEKECKLRWYVGENSGPAFSFLDLIKSCKNYDYYAFADQDDYWLPDKLYAGIMKIYNSSVPSLYCSNAELVDKRLQYLGRKVYKKRPKTDFCTLICSGGLLGCTMIFNNSLAKVVHNFDLPKNIVMHDFYLAALCSTINGKIYYDEKSYIKYRQHESNVVGVAQKKSKNMKKRMKSLLVTPKVSIADQAKELIPFSDVEKKMWLCKISNYKKNIFSRASLALTRKTKYVNINASLTLRLLILLGKR